jgi:hypothetical protein
MNLNFDNKVWMFIFIIGFIIVVLSSKCLCNSENFGPSSLENNNLGPSSLENNNFGPSSLENNNLGPSSLENNNFRSSLENNNLGPSSLENNNFRPSLENNKITYTIKADKINDIKVFILCDSKKEPLIMDKNNVLITVDSKINNITNLKEKLDKSSNLNMSYKNNKNKIISLLLLNLTEISLNNDIITFKAAPTFITL